MLVLVVDNYQFMEYCMYLTSRLLCACVCVCVCVCGVAIVTFDCYNYMYFRQLKDTCL